MTAILTIIMLLLATQDNLSSITGLGILSLLDDALVVFLAALSIFKGRKTNNKTYYKLLLLLVLFSITGIISCVINSETIINNVISGCFLSIKFWIVVLSVFRMRILEKERFIESAYKALFIVEKIVLLFAVINLIFPSFYISIFPASHVTQRFGMIAVCSLFNHPGKYGWFMLFCALAHLSKYDNEKNKKELVGLVIAIIGCLLSLRTKVILGIVICILAYFLYVKRADIKKWLKRFVVIIIMAVCVLIPFKDIILNTYTLYFTEKEGYSVRQALSDNSVKIASDYFPLGVGFGKYGTWYASVNYSEYYYKYGMSNMYGMTKDNTSYSTDTFWPALLGETGVIGTFVFVIMLAILAKTLIKNCNNGFSGHNEIVLLAPLVLVQTIVESFGSASFSSPPSYLFVAATIGLALSIGQIKNYERKKNEKNCTI